jgi:hypothetical protein
MFIVIMNREEQNRFLFIVIHLDFYYNELWIKGKKQL